MYWYDNQDNVRSLAEFLDSECCYFTDTAAVIRFFDKPWKWSREWEIFEAWLKSERDESLLRQICVEAIEDKNMTYSDVQAEYEKHQGAA